MKIRHHLHRRFGRVLFLGLILSSFAMPLLAQTQAWRMCDNCPEYVPQACAISIAHQHGLQTGDHAWILDFASGTASKFYLQVTPPGQIIQGESGEADKVVQSMPTVLAFEEMLTAEEIEGIAAVFQIVEHVYRPAGFGFDYPSCDASLMQTSMHELELAGTEAQTQSNQAVITFPVQIPGSSGHGSAYDIVGFTSLAVQLAGNHAGVLGVLGQAQSLVSQWIRTPLNTNVSLKLHFDDGSFGIWRFNFELDVWEPDWSTFRDSDGNPIPATAEDMPPGTGFVFDNEGNLQRFLSRAMMFGIPITGPGGGGTRVVCIRDAGGITCTRSSSAPR